MMKLLTILIFVTFLQVSAKTSAQSITLSVKNETLPKVFRQIKKQSGYQFFFNENMVRESHPVTLDVKEMPLEDVLDLCFKDQPLTFAIVQKTVVVRDRPVENIEMAPSPPAPPVTVQGKITNEHGEPLIGAIIRIKDSNLGAVTDDHGGFTLTDIDGKATLIITNIGYESQEIKLHGQQTLHIILKVKSNPLDQIQVIAYGTTTQRLATGNVTTVNAKEIEKQPVSNPLLALEGRVPGLMITQSTGVPGGSVMVQVQGRNSFFHGNDPLYVIDGVPYPSELLPNLAGGILGGTPPIVGVFSGYGNGSPSGNGSPLSYINPSDIESISVLKDADATSIYGSQAANGAIIITTKKGAAGPTRVDINAQTGWGQVRRTMDMMNTQQYIEMRKEAIRNDGLTIGPGDIDINGVWDTTRYTDWQKALIGGTAQYTNVNLSISGGNTTTQFLIGATYNRQGTVFLNPRNFSDQKGDAHFNLSNASVNQKFHVQLTGTYMIDNNMLPQTDLTNDALRLAPDFPALFNKDGSINWGPDSTYNSSSVSVNPAASLLNTYTNKTYNLISHADISYELFPGLDIKSGFGYNNLQTLETALEPLSATPPAQRSFVPRGAQYGNEDINFWIIQPQITYKRSIAKKGKLNALVGATVERRNSNGYQIFGSGYSSDVVLNDINSAPTISANYSGSTVAIYNYSSVFGRVNYNWNDKYIVNFTANRDGSSRFGSSSEFHNFGSVAGAWIFSSEHFIRRAFPLLSFGKLRVSYGSTGNDQIGDYTFMTLYTASPNYFGMPYQGQVGLQPTGLANPFIQWELTKKAEVGLDLGFLNDRFLLNISHSINRSSHQLLSTNLPILTGFGGVPANLPWTIQNTDWEITLNTINVQTDNFKWSTNFNMTIPQIGRWVGGPGLSKSSPNYNSPLNQAYVYHLVGVNDTTGIYEFADGKGGTTYNPSYGSDNGVLLKLDPKFYGGLGNMFSYKGFDLSFLLQFSKRIGQNYEYEGAAFGPGTFDGGYNNMPTVILNRWQKPGDKKPIEKYNSDYSLNGAFIVSQSDAAYTDASYIALKNVSLSWQLPEPWRRTAHLQNARLYVQGQNLLILTRYIGMDPENGSVYSIPPLRVLTVGVQIVL